MEVVCGAPRTVTRRRRSVSRSGSSTTRVITVPVNDKLEVLKRRNENYFKAMKQDRVWSPRNKKVSFQQHSQMKCKALKYVDYGTEEEADMVNSYPVLEKTVELSEFV